MVKNEVESLEVENSVEEVKEFFKGLGEEISQYSGFNLKIPVSLEKDTIEYNLKGKFSLNIPQVNNRVTMEILHIVQEILGKTVQVTHSLDRNILQNIQRDVSLSLINNEYLNLGSTQQYRFWENINALKNIGTKTYEGNSVNIGVIYSLNDELTIKEIKNLNVEVKLIEKRKTIQQFFLDEKPFLRLIDNKSLVVVVNKDFEVFAIIRKKDEGKSLSNIIQSQFNDWTINEMTRITFENLTDEFVRLLNHLEISDELKKKMSEVEKILVDYTNEIPTKEKPKFIYFSLTNKKMDIYLNKEYVISYNNGDWKLKQYALMLATIMQKVFTNTLHLPFSLGANSYNKQLLEMTISIKKLVNVIEMLSEKGGSSIFIIVLDNEQKINLTYSDAKDFLEKNNFKKNNLDRDFLNVVRNEKNI